MDDFQNDSAARTSRTTFRLDTGAEVLATWSATARQSHKNALYRTLFAMLDGSLLRTRNVVENFRVPSEFTVVIRHDLVVKLRVHGPDSFGIVHIGSWDPGPA